MKIVLQCSKCCAIQIDDWIRVEDDGTLQLGRWEREKYGQMKLDQRPRCHNCKSDELIIGVAHISGMKIP